MAEAGACCAPRCAAARRLGATVTPAGGVSWARICTRVAAPRLACVLLRLLVLLATAMTGCLLSSLCRTVNAAVVVCCAGLVGPAALELVGVRAAGILSLARLWTPVTCSLYAYLIPLALLIVCPLLCVRRRPRV